MAKEAKMKKFTRALIVLILTATALAFAVEKSSARIELTPLVDTRLGVHPVDVAVSDDGKRLFVLTDKQVVIYSVEEKKITKRVDLDKSFDRIRYSGRADVIVLSSTKSGALRTLKVDHVFSIDISGHPFKGPADAPVTIAVFDDYQ